MRPVSLFNALIALFCAVALQANAAFEKSLPQSFDVYVKVNDMSEFVEGWKSSPYGQFLMSEDMQGYLAPMMRELQDGIDELELDLGEETLEERFLRWFPGQTVIGMQFPMDFDSAESQRPPFAVIAEWGGSDEDFQLLIDSISDEANAPEDVKVNAYEEELMGYTLYIEEVDGAHAYVNGIARKDGMLILAEPVDVLKDIVVRLAEEDTTDSISDTPRYQAVQNTLEDHQLQLYFDLTTMIQVVSNMIIKAQEEDQDENQAALMGFSMDTLLNALALEELHTISIGLTAEEEEISGDVSINYGTKRGVLGLLAYGNTTPEIPNFIPEDAASVGLASFSLNEFWIALEQLVIESNPAVGSMFSMQMEQIKAQTGIDIPTQIFGNFAEGLAVYSTIDEDASPDNVNAMNQVIAFELVDSAPLASLFEFVNVNFMAGQLESSDYQGYSIYQFPNMNPGAQQTTRICITDKYFFLSMGGVELLHYTLAHYKDTSGGFKDSAVVRSVRDELPPHMQFEYQDMSQMLGYIFSLFTMMQNLYQMEGNDDVLIDTDYTPDPGDFPYYSITYSTQDEGSMTSKFLIRPKSDIE